MTREHLVQSAKAIAALTELLHSIFAFASPKLLRMGGERASTTRQRIAGKICCNCKRLLTPPFAPSFPPIYYPAWRTGERYCDKCGPVPEVIRCRMQYELVLGQWCVDILRDGQLIRHVKFGDSFKIEEMARRGGGIRDSECRNLLEYGIRHGSGALDLYLSAEQFAALKP